MSFGTVSMLTIPDQFEPVNTDGLWFQMNSASYSAPNYKYIVDVYSAPYFETSETGTVSLGSFKLPPRPVTGDGIFTPHKILKSQILNSPRVPISATGINVTYNSMVKYWLDYGFEMNPDIEIVDTFSVLGALGISFGTVSNPFIGGDMLTLSMDNKKQNIGYNTSVEVIGVGATSCTVDLIYATPSSSPETGLVTSVSRITSTTNQSATGSTSGNYTWNSIRQYDEKDLNFGDQYVLRSGQKSFLTSYTFSVSGRPSYIKPTRLGDYETLGCLINGDQSTSYQVNRIDYYGFDSSNNITQTVSSTFSTITYKGKFEVGVGPQNVIDYFGATVSFTNVDWYRIYLSFNSNAIGNIARRIDTTCTPYENVQLTWLNRLGSYEYWDFYMVSKKTLNTDRVEWKKQLGWDYTIGDRQQSILSQKATMEYVINSNWLSQYDYEFLNELITSPEVYRIVNTDRIPVVVTDTKWVQKTQLSDTIFNLKLSYKDAQNFGTQDN